MRTPRPGDEFQFPSTTTIPPVPPLPPSVLSSSIPTSLSLRRSLSRKKSEDGLKKKPSLIRAATRSMLNLSLPVSPESAPSSKAKGKQKAVEPHVTSAPRSRRSSFSGSVGSILPRKILTPKTSPTSNIRHDEHPPAYDAPPSQYQTSRQSSYINAARKWPNRLAGMQGTNASEDGHEDELIALSPIDMSHSNHSALHLERIRQRTKAQQTGLLHDGEGSEPLPPYKNDIHILGVLPLKKEFSSPGVQAPDRKWRRCICELEGTIFRVYRYSRTSFVFPTSAGTASTHSASSSSVTSPKASPSGKKKLAFGIRGRVGDWWERKVGASDISATDSPVPRPPVPPPTDGEAQKGLSKLTDDHGNRLRPRDEGVTQLYLPENGLSPTSPTFRRPTHGYSKSLIIPPSPSATSFTTTADPSDPEPLPPTKSRFLHVLNHGKKRERSHSRSHSVPIPSFEISPPAPDDNEEPPNVSESRPMTPAVSSGRPSFSSSATSSPRPSMSSGLPGYSQTGSSITSVSQHDLTSDSSPPAKRPASRSGSRLGFLGRSLGSRFGSTSALVATSSSTSTGVGLPSSSSVSIPLDTHSSSSSGLAANGHTPSSSVASVASAKSQETEPNWRPDPVYLIHGYSLQHAESGLANDYLKRKHVIRVRMEGEQFLLQLRDVSEVVAWIEVWSKG